MIAFGQRYENSKTFKIYSDLEIGLFGSTSISNDLCYINNKKVNCTWVKSTNEAQTELGTYFGEDTAYIKIYNLEGKVTETFYCAKCIGLIDTIGNYRYYFPNGRIKYIGKYSVFFTDEKSGELYDIPRSFKHGLWKEYNMKGILIREIRYKQGVVILSK